jgi:hypothetical protein
LAGGQTFVVASVSEKIFMSIQSISTPGIDQTQVAQLRVPGEASVVNLEDRLLQAFAESAIDTGRKASTVEAMTKRSDITDPEVLAVLQQRIGEYTVDVSMINTLVRKGVSTAETLLRSS